MSNIKFWKQQDFHETLYSKAFGVADYECNIGFSKFKMADPIWQIFWKPNDFRGTWYSRAFGVADYKLDIGFPFFEMADPI